MGAVTVSDLQGWELVAYLSAGEVARLARMATLHHVGAGQVIFEEGERAEAFWVVKWGRVKILQVSPEAREQVLRLVYPGESFGEAAALLRGTYPATAEAERPSVVVRFPAEAFREALAQNPKLAINVIVGLSQLLRNFAGLVEALALRDAPARVAKHLLDLAVQSKEEWVTLETSKRALAGRLGMVSETLSRTLRTFRKAGWIEVAGPRVRIVDRRALERAAAGLRE